MTTTTSQRFALDEEKAREWLAQAVAQNDAEDNGEDVTRDDSLPDGITSTWSPIWDDDYGNVTGNLVSCAMYADGVIARPEGAEIGYDYSSSEGDCGYTWLLYMPGAGRLKLSTYYSKITHLGDGDESRGADAALAILAEAVYCANALLDDLDAYVSALPLAVRAPELDNGNVWIAHMSHRHGDDITAHATYELARSWVAAYAREWWSEITGREDGTPDTPDGLSDDRAIEVYFDAQDDESYVIDFTPILTGAPEAPALLTSKEG